MAHPFTDMAVFAEVVAAGGFSAAANRLNLSKSAVSRRVADLEERLGVRLLNRTTRRIGLTEVGRAYHERCLRILSDVEETERAVTNLQLLPRGTLKITAPVTFGIRHLAAAVAAFLDLHPDIEIDLDLNDRYVELVEEGYDLAIRIGRLRDSALVARRLCTSRRAVVASTAYLARHGTPKVPDDLAAHACLHYTLAPIADQWLFRTAPGSSELKSIRTKARLRTNNGDLLREAAIAGNGIAVLPTFITGDAVREGKLEMLLTDYEGPPGAVQAVYTANRHLSAKVRAFVDFLAGRFGGTPYWDEESAAWGQIP